MMMLLQLIILSFLLLKGVEIFFYLSVMLLMILSHYPYPILRKMDGLKTDLKSGMFLMVISAEYIPLAGSSAGLMIVNDGREKELQCR